MSIPHRQDGRTAAHAVAARTRRGQVMAARAGKEESGHCGALSQTILADCRTVAVLSRAGRCRAASLQVVRVSL
jgi:hypothetical protein